MNRLGGSSFCRSLCTPALWGAAWLLLAVCVTVMSTTRVYSSLDNDLTTNIEEYIRLEMAAGKIPGLAIGIVQNGTPVYLKGFGLASIDRGTMVNPLTVFDLASCSKSFTALATLLLWHKGLVELDAPYTTYIPEFELDNNGPRPVITVRELLNQTSGLPGIFSEPVAYHQGPDAMKDLVDAMHKVGVNRAPGSSFEYTNLNYALLGALVERVSGLAFEDYVKINIFQPLGMNNSTLSPQTAARLQRADGHQLFFGRVVTRSIPIYRSMVPAGWVMSSAEDMCRWLELNLNHGKIDGEQLIPAEIIDLMQTTAVGIVKEGESAGYAMGWFTDVTPGGDPVLWHGGDTPNFLADMILLPAQNLGIILLINGQTSASAHGIAQHVFSLVAGKEIHLPAAPWWSSWRSVDDIGLYTSLLSLISLGALGIYIWWEIRLMLRLRKHALGFNRPYKQRKIWLFVLPATPWAVLLIPIVVSFTIMHALFGVNTFTTLIRVGYFAPPGVVVAAILVLVTLFLWAIGISLVTIMKPLYSRRPN